MIHWKSAASLAALTLAGNALALERVEGGTGQAILLPYYSAHAGRSTLFSITNHGDEAKAVRVVIAEGRNGRAALTFNLYLAPRDAWSGALSATSVAEASAPVLQAADASYTTGLFVPGGEPLRDDAYRGEREDGLGHDALRLHRGQIEIIELGTLTGRAAELATRGDCTGLRDRFLAGGAWATDGNADVEAPGGGLDAQAHLVDVAQGVGFDLPAIVFDGFSGAARHDNDYRSARIFSPNLAAGETAFTAGDAQFPADRGEAAVSYLLLAAQLEGEFLLDASMRGETTWVMSFPTRAAFVDAAPGGELPAGTEPQPPFAGRVSALPGAPVCMDLVAQVIDRAGKLQPAQAREACEQVLEFPFVPAWAAGDPAFDPLPQALSADGVESGRLRVDMPLAGLPLSSAGGASLIAKGLPVVAFSLMQARNAAAQPGLLATYALTGEAVRTK